jgi:hypothetical protein
MLITKETILLYRPLSTSVRPNIINSSIEDAEILDLMPLLGEKLYFDIVKNPANYTDLLEPKEYVWSESNVKSPGLKRVLVDFAWARHRMDGSQIDTPFGFVEKTTPDGTNVNRVSRKETYKQTQQTAMQYWALVSLYLDRNNALYPLWKESCGSSAVKRRFTFITR